MNFFISDLHFGHRNVIGLDERPFPDIDAMDAALIERWRAKVGADDDVYVIGDFCYRSARSPKWYLKALPGRKHLVTGNHDWRTLQDPDAVAMFASVNDILEIADGDRKIVMCHYPMIEWRGSCHGTYLVYGHIHNRRARTFEIMRTIPNALNAGAPVNNYAPATFDELLANNLVWNSSPAS